MEQEILFDTNNYTVLKLKDKVPVESNGITLYFHYGILNKDTDCMEGYSQFLPSAIEQATMLSEGLDRLLSEGSDVGDKMEDNVVTLEV